MTAQGHPRAIFKRAIERGNSWLPTRQRAKSDSASREALQFVLLYAAYDPAKVERAALRWFIRYLDEGKAVSMLKAQLALAGLNSDLRNREAAGKLLMELARR